MHKSPHFAGFFLILKNALAMEATVQAKPYASAMMGNLEAEGKLISAK